MALLFVFGTLKQGFCNFPVNPGRRLGGDWLTTQAFPLYINGPYCLPWLLDRPGEGVLVRGQLFEVDEAQLSELDRFEQVDEPLWYQRKRITVRPQGASPGSVSAEAWVYFGGEAGFAGAVQHAGPLAEYTLALADQHAINVP